MTRRATLRGRERTPIEHPGADVLVCGGSFAGLAVARELAGSGADVLLVDRYEIGERRTSACAAPMPWLEALGLTAAVRQEIPCMSFHTPHGSVRYRLPWSWGAFDYRELCELLFAACDVRFEIAKVSGRHGHAVQTDRGELHAPLVVDALGWRRVLARDGHQPPEAPLSRGLEVHPEGGGDDLDVWIERSLVRRGYGWSVPAGGEQRVGVGSYEPRDHVKQPTVALAGRLGRPAVRYQGNWFPHRLRRAAQDGVFFVGDSAGHCIPLSGEGIRTALYFGIACGRELRAVHEGRKTKEAALRNYAAFNDSHEWKFRWMLRVQKLVPRLPARVQRAVIAAIGRKRFIDWSFGHYLQIAPPEFAGPAPEPSRESELSAAA